jgi:hypothetical protein
MPFGVELPDNIAELADKAPEVAPESAAPDAAKPVDGLEAAPQSDAQKLQEILELDKVEKFKWKGKEITPKDLENMTLMRENFTQKTQELAEARKYVDNFDYDLDKLLENPNLLTKFKEIYPPQFVEKAEKILQKVWGQRSDNSQPTKSTPEQNALPPEIADKLSKLDRLEKWMLSQEEEKYTARVDSIQKELDSKMNEFGAKYKYADRDAVENKLSALIDHGQEITPEAIERVFKEKHENYLKLAREEIKTEQQKQLKVNAKAREAGPGGDVPAAAPQSMDLRKVREAMLRELNA